MNKKLKLIIIIVVVLAVITLLALPKLGSNNTNQPAAMNRSAGVQVAAHILQPEVIENKVLSSGSILAYDEVELRSELSGKITKIYFNEGTSVRKGDLLVKINDAEQQAQLRRAQYQLKLLEDKEYRQSRLLEKEAISQQDYDVSLNEVNIIKAEIDLINAQIAKSEIRAPFNGVVGLKHVSEGSFVTTTSVIASLQSISPVKIDFSIPEKYAGQVKPGDEVNFRVEGNSENFSAKVYAVEPKIDPVTRTLQIRALYHNSGRQILPGAFANIELILESIKDALMVPTQAIVPELRGQTVLLYKDGKAVSTIVQTGIRTNQRVQLTDGVNEGDTVVTSGILQIRPNVPIVISEFN
jgi:membrane fusion protein, multidrug efflux system